MERCAVDDADANIDDDADADADDGVGGGGAKDPLLDDVGNPLPMPNNVDDAFPNEPGLGRVVDRLLVVGVAPVAAATTDGCGDGDDDDDDGDGDGDEIICAAIQMSFISLKNEKVDNKCSIRQFCHTYK